MPPGAVVSVSNSSSGPITNGASSGVRSFGAGIARRADGWLPVHRPGTGPFDPAETITGPLADLRQLTEREGRDPASLGTVLRVYPVAGATVEDCVDTLRRAEQETETDHAFVDLQSIAENVDHALDLAHRILNGARQS